MEFFEVIKKRRSIRQFKPDSVPDAVIQKALDAALLAPNSSNTQTWDFYWVKSDAPKNLLVQYCLNQAAARTASHLIVVTADPKKWKRSQPGLIQFVTEVKAPKVVVMYYKKLIPAIYRWGILNSLYPIKWIIGTATGLFRPMMRGPHSKRDLQEMSIKSAALASENFVLAIAAQGYASCMMEGFDEWRVKSLLGLSFSGRVVMVIGVGLEGERGTWGPQWRLPSEQVIHIV